jgi:DNA-binding MarR family transcriptional regulator
VGSENNIEFDQASEVVRTLRRLAMAQRGRKVELLRAMDLQPGQDVILLELDRLDGPNQTTLADAVEVDEPSLARSIQRLERKDLITRRAAPEDARHRVVELTPKGEKLVPKLKKMYIDIARQVAGDHGSDFHRQLIETLETTIGRFES